MSTDEAIEFEHQHCAHNYHPIPVVIHEAQGAWVTDIEGRRYLDMLSAYSAINFGHGHPALVAAAVDQMSRVTLTSRAFHNDRLGTFCADLARLARHEAVLPMNSGAEGVETALKLARKWGYEVKGVPSEQAEIIVCAGNFHGRTTTIVSFSDDPEARDNYGPYTPGFVTVPYGDIDALRAAISPRTVAFLVEPIQGEAGVVLPPTGYLQAAHAACTENGVLFIADEIQAGLGRAGAGVDEQDAGVADDHHRVRHVVRNPAGDRDTDARRDFTEGVAQGRWRRVHRLRHDGGRGGTAAVDSGGAASPPL